MCGDKLVWVGAYGTLKVGGPLCHEDLIHYSRKGEHIKGQLYDLGHYPGLKLGGPLSVEVEVQLISEDYFRWMVYAEGSCFKCREVVTEEGMPVKIFEFLGDVSGRPKLNVWENSNA